MKIIEVDKTNGNKICLLDDDEREVDEITENLSELFTSDEVMILKTSNSGNLLIRPSKISSIHIDKYVESVNNDYEDFVTEEI